MGVISSVVQSWESGSDDFKRSVARRESEISGEERSVSDDMLKWQRVTFEERSVSDDGM